MSLSEAGGALTGPFRALLAALRSIDTRLALRRAGDVNDSVHADPILVGTLVLLGALGLVLPFDGHGFISADALYPVQIVEYGLFDFRPPPPNRIFPDVALHWLVSTATADPLLQKLIVGIVLFAAMAVLVGVFKGLLGFALFMAITVSGGFEMLVSASHYSLPLTVLIYGFVHGGRWQWPMLFVLVFSNPLVLVPLAVLLVEPADARTWLSRVAVVGAAMLANTLYSEFSETLVQMIVVFPVWFAGVWIVQRLGLTRLLLAAGCVALPVAAMLDLMPARYAIPAAGSMLVLLLPNRAPRFDWRYAVVPAVVVALFAVTVDWRRADRMTAAYDCLAGELGRRAIGTIAADYWTARPLDLAAGKAGIDLVITQTDFEGGKVHSWMAPHAYYGPQTVWGVRNADTCALIDGSATYCGQATVAPVAETVPLCGVFELTRYETPVPPHHEARPAGKVEAIWRNLEGYVAKVTGKPG